MAGVYYRWAGSFLVLKSLIVDIEALDGGGIRGFSQIFIMEELANRIMHDLGLQESPPLCDYFDMIGGTGTGGYVQLVHHLNIS
jgi:patatin-like phospholipase/acyl hydrolase